MDIENQQIVNKQDVQRQHRLPESYWSMVKDFPYKYEFDPFLWAQSTRFSQTSFSTILGSFHMNWNLFCFSVS
jgi:hypothetical protein